MADIIWTPSQSAAINTTSGKILISAAAGSGKSTVLTERIISSVTSKEKGYDISRILAVTFTKAASEELKAKISKEVRAAVMKTPDNKRLESQLIRLSSAKISTIHGLCLSLIRSHFQMLGLSASMRVSDETESAALRTEVLTELLENAYAGGFAPIPDFSHFAENFIGERDDGLVKILLNVYDKIKNIPNGFAEWERKTESISFDGDFGQSEFGRLILFHLSLFTDYALTLCENTVTALSEDENYADRYVPAFQYDLSFLTTLNEALMESSFRKISALLSEYAPVKLKNVPGALKTDAGEYARTVVKPFIKDKIKEFKESYFDVSEEELRASGAETAKIGKALITLLKEFDSRFQNEKKRRSLLDFNDLEHYTLKLLYNGDGSFSENAYRISESLDEIYVDEYQDVNPLQNKIFEALSARCPIFMVGDIKQSIYGFRGAEPSIFSDYRRAFDEFTPDKLSYEKNVTVFLSDNFRSVFNVTEFVNTVSDALFKSPDSRLYDYRIPYSENDRLICNKKDEAPFVSIMIAEEKKEPESVTEESPADFDGKNTEDIAKKTAPKTASACYLEAEMVANKIASLVAAGTETDKIAILLRSTKTDAPVFEAALKKRNIPISTEKGSSLFDAPEIQLSLCLLNCIDNPYRDIFLAGALRSPVFGFTLDDLIRVRQHKSDSSLFESLCDYTAENSFEKGRYFLEFLSRMRAFAIENTVDRTLWQIYTETAFFTLIYDGGAASHSLFSARRANLLKLHGMAKSFSDSGKSTLFSFIEYIRVMLTGETQPSAASVQGDGVKIMSIHHSKGLEFEHCFLARTTHLFSTESHKSSVTVDSQYGMAMRLKDELRLTSADTLYRRALIMQSDLLQSEEEMRLLYVALSRAQTALYISGTVKDFETTERACLYAAKTLHPLTFSEQSCYLKWILTALKAETELAPRYTLTVIPSYEIYAEAEGSILPETVLKEENTEVTEESDAYSTLKERFEYVYPYEKTAFIPSKLSVSRLYPEILDTLSAEEIYFGEDGKLIIPDFESFLPNGDKTFADTAPKAEATPLLTDGVAKSEIFSLPTDNTSKTTSILPPADSTSKTTSVLPPADSTLKTEPSSLIPDNTPKMKVPSFLLEETEASAAEKGTATHVFMQFCDFNNTEENGIEAEISRLTEKRFILPSHGGLIDRDAVSRFFSSELYALMKKAAFLQREYRFNIKLPASDFTKNEALREQVREDFVFVQGVIDCYFRDGSGRLYLLDYKTDRVPRQIKGNTEKETAFFTERHGAQLGYYKKALEKLTGEKVFKTVIYSFSLGKTIEIKDIPT